MAIVKESVSTAGWTGVNDASSLSVTAPSGITTGDQLLAFVGVIDEDGTTFNISTPSGWTSLGEYKNNQSSTNATVSCFVYKKIADAGDEVASNYSWTNSSGEGVGMAAIIYRMSGSGIDSLQIVGDIDNSVNVSNPSFDNSVTPNFANSYLFFVVTACGTNAGDSNADQAIATDNPTWTEDADLANSLFSYFGSGNGAGPKFAAASASRPQTTATGTSSLSFTQVAAFPVGLMVALPPQVPVSISVDAPGTLALSQGGEPTYTLGFVVDIDSPGTLNLSGQDNPVTAQEYEQYTDQNKPSTSWTNQSK